MNKSPSLSTERISFLHNISKAKSFISREFLTWIWYRSETDPTVQARAEGYDFQAEFWVDDRIEMTSPFIHAHDQIMKGGEPAGSHEASVALMTGKLVRELKIGVRVDGIGEFFSLLHQDDLAPKNLKLPDPEPMSEGESSGEHPLGRRLALIHMFMAIIDQLFREFVDARTEGWEDDELPKMQSWIRSKRSSDLQDGVLH